MIKTTSKDLVRLYECGGISLDELRALHDLPLTLSAEIHMKDERRKPSARLGNRETHIHNKNVRAIHAPPVPDDEGTWVVRWLREQSLLH